MHQKKRNPEKFCAIRRNYHNRRSENAVLFGSLKDVQVLFGVKKTVGKLGCDMSRKGENIRKRKDGRWEGRYIKSRTAEGQAKYTSVYAKTYVEVKQKLTAAKNNSDIEPEKKTNPPFGKILLLWLENSKIKVKKSTYEKYRTIIEKHLMPSVGNVPADNIDTQLINKVIREKSLNGRLDSCGGLSPTYVGTIAFIMKSAAVFAYETGNGNALKGTVTLPAKPKSRLKILSLPEQERLERVCFDNLSDKELGIILSLYTGMRLGEVCALQWEDIDLKANTVHICHTVQRVTDEENENGGKTRLVLSSTKSADSDRIIPIPSKLQPLLSDNKKGFVIKGTVYDYTDPRTLQYQFKKKLKESNVENINFHALRHTFATRCIESGMDAKTLSEILGHSDVNITLGTYVHSSMELKRKQMEAMVSVCGQNCGSTNK